MASADYLPPLRHDGQATDDYKLITVAPVTGSLAAVISGIDLSHGLEGDLLAEVRRALLNHLVLVFPAQNLSAEQLIALGATFGSLHVNPFVAGLPDHPEIMQIRSEENETVRFAGRWHSDITWEARPSMGSLLHARTIPPYGGDTLFANMYMAWEALTPTMRRPWMVFRPSTPHSRATIAPRHLPMRPTSSPIRSCAPIPRPDTRRSSSTSISPAASRA